MSYDPYQQPLLAFMDRVHKWSASLEGEHFWRMVEPQRGAEQLRAEAKDIIVWLELKGQEDAAAQLDDAMAGLRRAVWDFEEACEGVYPPEDFRCEEAREAMVEAAGPVEGAAEDLDDEIPPEVWEGFLDG